MTNKLINGIPSREYFAQYRARNKEKCNATSKAYYHANKDNPAFLARYKDYRLKYYQDNKERLYLHKKLFRLRKRIALLEKSIALKK